MAPAVELYGAHVADFHARAVTFTVASVVMSGGNVMSSTCVSLSSMSTRTCCAWKPMASTSSMRVPRGEDDNVNTPLISLFTRALLPRSVRRAPLIGARNWDRTSPRCPRRVLDARGLSQKSRSSMPAAGTSIESAGVESLATDARTYTRTSRGSRLAMTSEQRCSAVCQIFLAHRCASLLNSPTINALGHDSITIEQHVERETPQAI